MTRYYLLFLQFFLLFNIGTVAGWFLELFWRRFFGKARRWINPGFLNGPWLPLYGFGCVFLYTLCLPEWPLHILIPLFFVSLTFLEYLAGRIFIEHFKIKLWDYSHNRGNVRGLICPLYSVFWTVLGLLFYYFVYPRLQSMTLILADHGEYSFFIGIFGGLFAADIWQSFDLALRIRTFVNESEERFPVDFEKLKLELRDRVQEGLKNRTHFFLPFHGELGSGFRERLRNHLDERPRPLKPLKLALNKKFKKD